MGRLSRKVQSFFPLSSPSFTRLPKASSLRDSLPCQYPPKGYLPVCVGNPCQRRYFLKAEQLNHPLIAELLLKSAEEFGYSQHGALQIVCDEEVFEDILRLLSARR